MENVLWMAITPKRGFSMMKKSEFLASLFRASLEVVREYYAVETNKNMFDWVNKSAVHAENLKLLGIDERGLAPNPVLKAVETLAIHRVTSSIGPTMLKYDDLPMIEEAWEHYQEKSKDTPLTTQVGCGDLFEKENRRQD